MNPLRIILLEDSMDDAVLIENELKKAGIIFVSLIIQQKDQFEAALEEFNPDVILCDHSLPQFNSIEAFKIYKQYQSETGLTVPFILVTGNVSEEFAVQSFKAGVDDYILKDRLKRLPLSIESALEKCRIERDRRKLLSKAIEKEALMNEAEELAHFCSWQSDLLTGKLTWSDAAFHLYGYEPGEIDPYYEDFYSHVHPDDIGFVQASKLEAIKNQETAEYNFRIIDKKGQLKYISCKLQVHRDENGLPLRLVGFNLDVTQRKQGEMALQKSEQEYKSLFDQNPDPVFSFDVHGKFTKVNKGVEELTGLTGDELRGMDFRMLVHPDDLDSVYSHFLAALDRNPQNYEARMINPKGKMFTLNVTNMPIVVNDEIIGVHGVAKDITEKRNLEDLLEQAHRFARIGGWEFDIPNEKIAWTSITRELHEVDADFEPTLEQGVQFYKAGENRDAIVKALDRCMAEGTPWDVELQIITGQGNTRWVRSTGEGEMKNGKCVRMFGTFQDIHKRKEAEEIVKDAYKDKVGTLESITQLKEIAWIQSDEIRGPLARLMGVVNLLKNWKGEENEVPQLLCRIQNSAEELDALVRKTEDIKGIRV